MYKKTMPEVPTNGGLPILIIAIFTLSILTLFYAKYITAINYTIIVVVVLFALFGLLDDMVNIGRPAKLILLYYCSYPLIPFITTTTVLFPFFGSTGFIHHLPADYYSDVCSCCGKSRKYALGFQRAGTRSVTHHSCNP